MDSCFDLVGSCQHGAASNEVISWLSDHPYPLNADGDDLRWNSNPNLCRLAYVTCKTHDKGKQEKSAKILCRSAAAIRKLRTDKNCPAEKSWRKGIAVSRENWMGKNFMGYLKCAGGKHWLKKLNREKEDPPPPHPPVPLKSYQVVLTVLMWLCHVPKLNITYPSEVYFHQI